MVILSIGTAVEGGIHEEVGERVRLRRDHIAELTVDLPGVDQDGLKLSVEEGVLTIEGHVKQPENREYLVREFEPVNFYRQFELSETVDQEGINAELKNGVLNIFLPRAKSVQPRTIEVKFS